MDQDDKKSFCLLRFGINWTSAAEDVENLACEASVSVLFWSKGHAKNGASKRGGGGEERKETLADKPRDFEDHPHRLSCLSGRTDI